MIIPESWVSFEKFSKLELKNKSISEVKIKNYFEDIEPTYYLMKNENIIDGILDFVEERQNNGFIR